MHIITASAIHLGAPDVSGTAAVINVVSVANDILSGQPVLGTPLIDGSGARHISLPNTSSNTVAIDTSLNSVTVDPANSITIDPSATTFSKAA